jgi:hypothetical protein
MEVLDMKVLGKALAFVMLLALVGAGTATAAKMITGEEIANHTITGLDVEKRSLGKKHLTVGARAALKGAVGPAGPAGPAGAAGPQGPQGDAGSADAYGEFTDAGALGDDPAKGFEQVGMSHDPNSGIYCFTFPAGGVPKGGAASAIQTATIVALQIEATGAPGCSAGENVRVSTYNSAGVATDYSFRLLLENG